MKLSNKYTLLKSTRALEEFDDYLMEGDSPRFDMMAVDTETNGLCHWKDVVIGISFSVNAQTGFYLPFLHWVGGPDGHFKDFWSEATYPENVTQKEYTPPKFLKDYVKRWLGTNKIDFLLHNAPFDCLMIENNLGIDISTAVFCDVWLLKHVLDENSSSGLKDIAVLWQRELGIPAEEQANKEQIELGASIIANGGTYNTRTKHVWRADLEVLYKYAVADTFLTYGVYEVGIQKFSETFTEKHFAWFFEDEVMPFCREVMIDMKRQGVRVNVPYFEALEKETLQHMDKLEDEIVDELTATGLLKGFALGKSLDEAVSKKRLMERILELEGLTYPTKFDKKTGEHKKTMSKPAIAKAYEEEPHWLWGYLLGKDELKYSSAKLLELKTELFREKSSSRHRFNIRSGDHLTWLFCDRLGYDRKSLPPTKGSTKENPTPSMAAEVLEEYFLKNHSFVKTLLTYKKLKKLHSTYIIPALELNVDWTLYMDFLQAGTTSGRLACSGGFNLQTLPAVEEIEKCNKCKSKNISIHNHIRLIAEVTCKDCKHVEKNVICPSAIKEGFIPPEGMDIANADYSSLEPRCFAFMSSETKLKEIYEKNQDMYSKVYCDMMGEEYRDLKKSGENDKRTKFKRVPLGIVYGARDGQTANLMELYKKVNFNGEEKEIPDKEQGKYYRNLFLETYPTLHKYMLTQENKANTLGFVETLIGRRRHFIYTVPVFKLLTKAGIHYEDFLDETNKNLQTYHYNDVMNTDAIKWLSKVCDFNLWDPKTEKMRDWSFIRAMYRNELNNAKNFPMQGLAAHITNRAMIEISREYKKQKVEARLCLQVHDEITSYSKKQHSERARAIIKKCMETNKFALLLDIPMVADPVITYNLKNAK